MFTLRGMNMGCPGLWSSLYALNHAPFLSRPLERTIDNQRNVSSPPYQEQQQQWDVKSRAQATRTVEGNIGYVCLKPDGEKSTKLTMTPRSLKVKDP